MRAAWPAARGSSRSGAKRLSVFGFAAIAALLTVGVAAAASHGTQTPGFGAATKMVTSCGSGMKFAYTTSYQSGIGDYAIDRVTVSDIPPGCLNQTLALTFYDGHATAVGSTVTVTLPSSGTTDAIPIASAVEPSLVSGVSVVATGPGG